MPRGNAILPNIYKRALANGRTVYDVKVSVGGMQHMKRGLSSLEAAKKWKKILLDKRDGTPVSLTVEELAWLWVEDAALRLEPSTLADYSAQLRLRILPALGQARIDAVRAGQLQELVNKSARQLRTAAKTAVVLKALFKAAVLWGLLDASPAAHVRAHGQKKREMTFLTQEQARALLSASEGSMRLYVLIGLSTGLRPGEMLALKWEDIKGRKVHVRRAKTAAGIRTVAISQGLAGILAPERGKGYVFQLDGEPWTAYNLRWRFRKAVEQANLSLPEKEQIKGATPHSLRHTYAAWLMSEEMSVKFIQQQLGHTEPMFTVREYGHLVPGKAEEMADACEAVAGLYHEQSEQADNVVAFPQVKK